MGNEQAVEADGTPLFGQRAPEMSAFRLDLNALVDAGDTLVGQAHGAARAAGWWHDLKTGVPKERNAGEMIALIHSELSEALEGVRKSKMDEHLPHRKSEEVEMADAVIRIADYCGGRGLDLGGALADKMLYNQRRADHKPAARLADDGKKF
jgi:NTP pyrophosphatase (non-canonical NTP hydrolase)